MALEQTIDVLMAGYLSNEAASEDFAAVKATGTKLIALVRVSRDLEGTVTVDQEDHTVKEGAVALGGAGLVVGLFAPPLLAATAIGAAIGAGVGKVVHNKLKAGIEAQGQETIPIGGAGLIVAYPPESSAAVEGAVARAIKRAVGEGRGSHVKALKAAMADAQAKLSAAEG
jgi:uncharacterized membrane protein